MKRSVLAVLAAALLGIGMIGCSSSGSGAGGVCACKTGCTCGHCGGKSQGCTCPKQ